MGIVYETVASKREKHQLYQFRRQVFVGEERRWQTNSDHLTDIYDQHDETVNIVAKHGNKIIAALRVTPETDGSFPADQYWNFKSYRKGLKGALCQFWMAVLRPKIPAQ